MTQVRDAIDRMRGLAQTVRIGTCEWVRDCDGQTMRHNDLFQIQREIDWAAENILAIKADVDASCAEARADLTTKGIAA